MEEVGVVKTLLKNQVEVEIDPSNVCGQCANKSACHLSEDKSKRTILITSELQVKPGDLVQIEMNEGRAIFSAFLIFIFPLLCLGIGYFEGVGFGEKGEIIGAIAGLIFGFLLVWLIDRRIKHKTSFQPTITRILEHCPIEPPN